MTKLGNEIIIHFYPIEEFKRTEGDMKPKVSILFPSSYTAGKILRHDATHLRALVVGRIKTSKLTFGENRYIIKAEYADRTINKAERISLLQGRQFYFIRGNSL